MIIDVMINSCARPELLELSLKTFKAKIKSDIHQLRWVLVEDKVDDIQRRAEGLKWIQENNDLFDEIIILKEKAGVGFWWQETIKHCTSDYHIHVEDDGKYLTEINIDSIIEVMQINDDIINIIFSRGSIKKENNLGHVTINNVNLTKFALMSVATGMFNTNNIKKLLGSVGWKNKIHEKGTLTPFSEELGFRKFILGHNIKHYEHIGAKKEYRKGKYR